MRDTLVRARSETSKVIDLHYQLIDNTILISSQLIWVYFNLQSVCESNK